MALGDVAWSSSSSSDSESSDEDEILYCQYERCGVALPPMRQSQYCSRACRLRASTRLLSVPVAAVSPVVTLPVPVLAPTAVAKWCSGCGYYLPAGTINDYCDDCLAEHEKQTRASFDPPMVHPLSSDGKSAEEDEDVPKVHVIEFFCKWCGVVLPTSDYGYYCSDECSDQYHGQSGPLAGGSAPSTEEEEFVFQPRLIECLVCRNSYPGACPRGHEIIWIPYDGTNQIQKIQ